jgi:hypothetical protein
MGQQPRRRVLNIDIGGMLQRAKTGVVRPAAFLGVSEHVLKQELPRSLTLGGSVQLQLLPDPIPDALAAEIKPAFRDWVVGNALRELDQFVSLMLDEAWDIVQAIKVFTGEHPKDHIWRRIHRTTNVAEKHRLVLETFGDLTQALTDDNSCLASLSNARNALAHGLGIVTDERATDGALSVKWIALQLQAKVGTRTIVLNEENVPFDEPLDEEADLVMAVVIKERPFAVGEHVVFTPGELLEICLFYQMVMDRVALAVEAFGRAAGVPFSDLPSSETKESDDRPTGKIEDPSQ